MTDLGSGREPMLEMYLFEVSQLLEQLEAISIECEKDKTINGEAINEIFRIMHTLKSSSAMMLFNNISVLAHSLEDLFYFIRENKDVVINFDDLFDIVLLGIDFIKGEATKIENDKDADGSNELLVSKSSELLDAMKKATKVGVDDGDLEENQDEKFYISFYKSTDAKESKKYAARIFFEEGCEMENVRAYTVIHNLKNKVKELLYIPSDIIENNNTDEFIRKNGFLICFSTSEEKEDIEDWFNQIIFLREFILNEVEEYPQEIKAINSKKQKSKEDNEVTNKGTKQQSMLSVNIFKLDMLLDLVGEIVISEAMVERNPDLEGLELDNFDKSIRQLRKLTNELQDIVMSIRMVPVSLTFLKMNRIVRDMSKKLGKEVDLEIIGEETEVDKNIIDHISDPLMHLVRNSIDHGLEERVERIALGKPERGTVTLEARNAGGDVFIIVKDDGRGLDRGKIYEKALAHGLTSKAEHELTDKEIFSYIFLPGFSTNEDVTEYSGRGVGMDVVKKNIDSIGGVITVDSLKGIGTNISIKIPLTLAIIYGLEVAVGRTKYTIPINLIKESFRATEEQVISDSQGNEMIMIRGEAYPILRLYNLFNIKTDIKAIDEGLFVMVESESKAACLFVDGLIGEQQVVVKALPKYIKKVDGIAGCTILGDGNISLILDVNQILNM